jgi:hypothetical protein
MKNAPGKHSAKGMTPNKNPMATASLKGAAKGGPPMGRSTKGGNPTGMAKNLTTGAMKK